MTKGSGLFVAGLPLVILLTACVATTPGLDRSFGNAVRAAVAAQVIDPGAVRNTNAPPGIDGRAALAAQRRYQHSFGAPSGPDPAMTTGGGK
jgi:hypothetical protein